MRAKSVIVTLCVMGAMAMAGPAIAQSPLSPGQEILMSRRAAQVDAYRKLAEEIKGLRIDSTTYVRDFVGESDQINTALDTFIKGAKMVGAPRYLPDGTCEVDVQVTLKQVMQCLKRIHLEYPDGRTFAFDKMGQYTKKTVFTATGESVPKSASAGAPELKGVSSKTAGIPGWERVTPQGRLLAERGALTDARRNLAETVKGLRITGNTYVKDFVVMNDQVQTQLNTFIKGIKESSPYRYLPGGICEVDVEVTIQNVIKELNTIRHHYIAGFPPTSIYREIKFEKIIGWDPPKVIRATGSAAVPARGYLKGPAPGPGASSGPVPASDRPSSGPSWASGIVTANGTGVPREGEEGTLARLNAERAAEADARRNLVEKVYGVNIDARTTVRDYVTVNDRVKADVSQYLAAARVVGEPRNMPDGTVEITMELPLDGVWAIVGAGAR